MDAPRLGAWVRIVDDVLRQRWHVRHLAGRDAVSLCGPGIRGQRVVVTGPTSGIGTETARALCAAGAHVVLACRSQGRGEALASELRAAGGTCEVALLDLSELASVRRFARAMLDAGAPLHALVNNAGIFSMGAPEARTADGHESHLGTNFLAPALLTLLLLPLLRAAAGGARVVHVSSKLHELGRLRLAELRGEGRRARPYSSLQAYAQSKLAEVLFSEELARRLGPGSSVRVMSLHPGNVLTDVVRTLPAAVRAAYRVVMSRVLLTPAEGCRSTVWCAASEEAAGEAPCGTAAYFDSGCRREQPRVSSRDQADARALWDLTLEVLALPAGVLGA